MNFELISFANAEELAQAAASEWLDEIAAAGRAAKTYCVALSGGRIALKFFSEIVKQAGERAIFFGHVHFFWADERCVPPDDSESNFKTADELLFAPLKISEAQIHRIRGEDLPDVAVQKADMEISSVAPSNSDGLPVLDLIFLGLGEDGHVASLFPNAVIEMTNRHPFLFVPNSPKPPPNRVSLNFPAIAAAKKVWVLASGAGKETALKQSLSENGRTPLARVIESRPQTKIFSDIFLD